MICFGLSAALSSLRAVPLHPLPCLGKATSDMNQRNSAYRKGCRYIDCQIKLRWPYNPLYAVGRPCVNPLVRPKQCRSVPPRMSFNCMHVTSQDSLSQRNLYASLLTAFNLYTLAFRFKISPWSHSAMSDDTEHHSSYDITIL